MPQNFRKNNTLALLFALAATIISFTAAVRANGPTPEPLTDWRTVGPMGGDTRALAEDPSNPDRLYAGTLDGHIYASTDAGQNWRLLYNFHRPQLVMDSLLVDLRDSNVLYAGAFQRHQEPGGFYKSTDGGLTWNASAEFKNEAIYSLFQSSKNPDLLLAGTNHGIFRSGDSGASWVALPTQGVLGPDGKPGGLKNVESLAVDLDDTNILYAGTWYLPYKSTDGGQTWRVIKTGMIEDSDVFAIDVNPREPRHIFASACSGIYESLDYGENWKKVNGIPSSSRRTRAIRQHPTIPNLVFAGTTEGFWRSENGGTSWILITSKALETNAIAIHPERPNDIYISTNNYGVMVSHDAGKTFTQTNDGYSSRFTRLIVPDIERPNRFYAATRNTARGGGFLFVSNDGGATWQPSMRNLPSLAEGQTLLQDAKNPNTIYLGTNLGLYRSLDRGASWASVSPAKRTAAASVTDIMPSVPESLAASAPAPGETRSRRVTPAAAPAQVAPKAPAKKAVARKKPAAKPAPKAIFLSEKVNSLANTWAADGRTGLLAATDSGLYRTFDSAKGGQMITYGTAYDKRTNFVMTSEQEPNTIWVGTVRSGVLVSRDAGATWQRSAGVPNEVPVIFIKQDPMQPERLYVGTMQALYTSRDGGANWRRRGGGLPFGYYVSLAINAHNSNEIIVGNAYQSELGGDTTRNTGGVYRSVDGGDTWGRIDPGEAGLPSQRIWALAFDSTSSRLLVGSHSAGIYLVERKATAATLK